MYLIYSSAAASTLGGLKGWSGEQLLKLKENCVALYGSISTWDSADIREAGVAIGIDKYIP